MGQQEIYAFLKQEHDKGNTNYFTIHEIKKNTNGGSKYYSAVRRAIYSLVRRGVIENRVDGDVFDTIRVFRYKKE